MMRFAIVFGQKGIDVRVRGRVHEVRRSSCLCVLLLLLHIAVVLCGDWHASDG